ncbi:YncE family protein [Aquimonas voraii]|uniref:Fibronectin type-III domain-containing protein n=1 Tax=Aquimonas voraii TaxID=265719 RepID=A0A1G6X797_9GAMM|nr:fibronectin type III domain-containing protein [Aquimonas voraii]SDD74040.1 hypothetical protein SAMN04488509_10677 [Aquimonas voraii]
MFLTSVDRSETRRSRPHLPHRRAQISRHWAGLLILWLWLLGTAAPALAQTPFWVGFQVEGEVAYILRKSPSEILRYDLATEQWLPALPLQDEPSAFVVGTSHIFIASDRKIERVSLEGTGKTHVANTPDSIHGLFINGDILIANRSRGSYTRFSSFNTDSNALIDTYENYPRSMVGASHSPSTRRIFGRTESSSPGSLMGLTYDSSGHFLDQDEIGHYGAYGSANRTWAWPDGRKLVDNSGNVHLGLDLSFAGRLTNNISDVAFHGLDVPIVLSNTQLIAFNQALIETGRVALALPGRGLAVRAGTVFVFNEDSASPQRIGVEKVPLSALSPAQPGAPVSPIGLDYTVTSSAVDDDGIVYLLSKAHSSIFRWDISSQAYLSTISLPVTGDLMVFSTALNALFLRGLDRTVYRINLAPAVASVEPFATPPDLYSRMIPMGSDLLVAASGSSTQQWVYSSTGALLSSSSHCCHTFHFFDAPRNRLFVNAAHLTYLGNGQFSGSADFYAPGSYSPLGISPDGQQILAGQGVLYQASPLQAIGYLSNNVSSVAWIGADRMLTVLNPGPGGSTSTTVQRWSPGLAIEAEVLLPGSHVAFHASGNRVVQITNESGRPRLYVLDDALGVLPPATLDAPLLELASASAFGIALQWSDVQGERAYDIERRQVGGADWLRVGVVDRDTTRFTDVDRHSGRQLEYRVRSRNGSLVSAWSNPVGVDLSTGSTGTPVDPNAVAFTVDKAAMGRDGRIYILSTAHRSVFVWNPHGQRFERTIALRSQPEHLAYSSTRDALFIGYADNSLYAIDPKAEIPVEHRLADTESRPIGLLAADDVVVASTEAGWSHSFSLAGQRVGSRNWGRWIAEGVWSSARQRIYHFGGFALAYTPVERDGTLGFVVENGNVKPLQLWHPIRVSPDGNRAVTGSGHVFDANSLEHLGTLSREMIDAAWLGGELLTLRRDGLYWQPSELSAAERVADISGLGRGVFTTPSGRIVTVVQQGVSTVLTVYNRSFQVITPPLFADGFD